MEYDLQMKLDDLERKVRELKDMLYQLGNSMDVQFRQVEDKIDLLRR